MSTRQRRLSPEASRQAALEAAREILLEQGARAITLQAVAKRMGRTPGNLLHHFGSVAELQTELGLYIARGVTSQIGQLFSQARRGELDPRRIVDMSFDAFDREGGGALAGWQLLTGNADAVAPVIGAIAQVSDELVAAEPERTEIPRQILSLTLLAMGNSMLGKQLAEGLGLPGDAARELAMGGLLASMAYHESDEVRAAIDHWVEQRFARIGAPARPG